MKRLRDHVEDFINLESAGGIVLIFSAVIAMVWANLAHHSYEHFLHLPFSANFLGLELNLGLSHFVSDGLMAIFFLMVGAELRREVTEGYLSNLKDIVLPVILAIVGFVIPAAIYMVSSGQVYSDGSLDYTSGWAIPTATDIAFALGLLSLFGKRVPVTLKVTLLALAIFDDLLAIAVIAIGFSKDLNLDYLMYSGLAVLFLAALRMARVYNLAAYLVVGAFLWAFMIKSGVHATLSGVIVAMFLPYGDGSKDRPYLIKNIEHSLHEFVSFGIVPIFTICNAGIYVADLSIEDVFTPLSIIIAVSMFFGKTLGVFLAGMAAIKIGLCEMPKGVNKLQFLGMSSMSGIGFTMALFIGGLGSIDPVMYKTGVLLGTIVSALVGCFILNLSLPKVKKFEAELITS